ncbi:UDP-2,4-diacetamido-2,4,6-trideoxy-beta-L-altropyranose hydrolase [Paenibacillus kribbensis]|uniref:UDP-2,4-diacetamido-2,4, 6-trideoxy-beta-L-altropyranose hydrolase n=1 Tax=Paenibacillus kribbensis TaxID=172713 RepID=UPI002DBE7327|nr:UDP-2,4-diacetamido-2,4,6-trideoxy-beta-L-altropyranose hydrolase [Paenibacillus kribbensis]MEC0234312.1 UDP-2,4-diacetamido-2,4,6-trideoxy-beta-L-altropyranose hydrolase [Paenibacillus kribbensis]
MKFLIRADASIDIGTGHVMRCLALAKALIISGSEVVFVFQQMPDHLVEKVKQIGCIPFYLNSEYPVGSIEDAVYVSSKINNAFQNGFDWMIIDHYRIGDIWEIEMYRIAKNILVIDDLADRMHICNILLDQNLYESSDSRYNKLTNNAKQLIGPSYALLREEFYLERQEAKTRSGAIQRVLVTFGGTDPTNETLKSLYTLEKEGLLDNNLDFDILVGQSYGHLDELRKIVNYRKNMNLHIQSSFVAAIMKKADLAICSGGTLTWERYCMGLPGLVIAVAENQIHNAMMGEKLGIDRFLGFHSDISDCDIVNNLKDYHVDLENKSLAAFNIVDGRGVEKVIKILETIN